MSNRWVTTQPYIFAGHNYSSIKATVTNSDGSYSTTYCVEQILVDEHGQPICVVHQNERTETYDVTAWVLNSALIKHGGVFKHLDAAVKWCENNDWSVSMPTSSDSNGVQQTHARPNERQHCPACNTDGEHSFAHTDTNPNVREKKEFYMCATCGDVHVRTPVTKSLPTVESNRRTMANQPRIAHERTTDIQGMFSPMRLTQALPRSEQPLDEIEKAAHYNQGKIEVIEAVEDWKLGPHEFTAVIYIARAKHKGTELKDLKKARWYLNRRIEQLEAAEAAAAKAVPQ